MQPSYIPVTTYTKATPLQRFIAVFIDGLVGYVPFMILIFLSSRLVTIGYVIAIAYSLTKDALPEMGGFLGGQSVGKKLMGIKVIKEDTGGSLLGDYGTAITRQVSLLIPLFNIIDALMVFSADSKRFGDKWAKTIVVKVLENNQAGVNNTNYYSTPSKNVYDSPKPQNNNTDSSSQPGYYQTNSIEFDKQADEALRKQNWENSRREADVRINQLKFKTDLTPSEQQELDELKRISGDNIWHG